MDEERKAEFQKILAMLNELFPVWKVENKTVVLNMWMEMLKDYDTRTIEIAVKSYIATDTKGYAPSIGQIIGIIHTLQMHKEEMSSIEAWSLVRKAISNGYYGAEEEFAKLPDACKKAIGNASLLREWASMDEDMVDNTIFANFRKTYDRTIQRMQDIQRLPSDIRQVIEEKQNLLISADE